MLPIWYYCSCSGDFKLAKNSQNLRKHFLKFKTSLKFFNLKLVSK
ncbi:hypothetical protein [Cyanobacterium stanieri]